MRCNKCKYYLETNPDVNLDEALQHCLSCTPTDGKCGDAEFDETWMSPTDENKPIEYDFNDETLSGFYVLLHELLKLSERELFVYIRIATRHTTTDIAKELGVQLGTISNYKYSISKKSQLLATAINQTGIGRKRTRYEPNT